MAKWTQQIEEEITLLIKEWLKHKGKTQKDLKASIGAESERMPILLKTFQVEYISGGLPKLAALFCAIDQSWSTNDSQNIKEVNKQDPFGQLDLLLQEIKEAPPVKMERDDHVLLVDGLNNFIRCFIAIFYTKVVIF